MISIDGVLSAVTLAATLGTGLMAGLFFAFSVAVMRALARLPPAEGIAAMQAINVVILNPVFLSVFMGTTVACAIVTIAAIVWRHEAGAGFLFAGGALYLVGNFVVTMVCNVPRNDALAAVAPTDPSAAGLWARYLAEWTLWNHVRTATALAALASLAIALCCRAAMRSGQIG